MATFKPALPLCIRHGRISHRFSIPSVMYEVALSVQQNLDAFIDIQPQENKPTTVEHLILLFVESILNLWRKLEHKDASDICSILRLVLHSFHDTVLVGNDIHCVLSSIQDFQHRRLLIQSYYTAQEVTNLRRLSPNSRLLQAASNGEANICYIFGGQGLSTFYLEELRQSWNTYRPILRQLFDDVQQTLQDLVASLDQNDILFPDGINILDWLDNPCSSPSIERLIAAPLSCPLLALVSLSRYCILAKITVDEPQDLLNYSTGVTGHSQGIVVAAIISTCRSWEDFYEGAKLAITILFWIGVQSELSYRATTSSNIVLEDSVSHSEGIPSPMLSIRGLSEVIVQDQVFTTNSYLQPAEYCYISLLNGPESIVVSGPSETLYGLSLRLRKYSETKNGTTERTRKPKCHFLTVSAPSHSPYLQDGYNQAIQDLKFKSILRGSLILPCYDTCTGDDLRNGNGKDNIIPGLVRMIMVQKVDWVASTRFPSTTHVVDFGPGGTSGAGALLRGVKRGMGIRVLLADFLEEPNANFGDLRDILSTGEVHYENDWSKDHSPKLVRIKPDKYIVDTKFSRFFGLPPIIVAGMHPTTVSPEFVISIMNSGYHTELAGGGYVDEKTMERAILKIQKSTLVGRGISCNLLYVSPRSLAWQIPMIRRLREKGVNIEGITIGGGVPSINVAAEYINNLGLNYIAFKPSSEQAINEVISIAKAHPQFPILLQWTGGRGGGHHSNEDFHEPITKTYDRIRSCKNVILLAGSGFGGIEDTYLYLSGMWSSTIFGLAPMPFDAIMLGSRVMASKEAPGSLQTKQAIANAQGTDDSRWWDTSVGTHGIISVKSEWGQPMHMIANRGTVFWSEIDRVLALPKSNRIKELKRRKSFVIEGLNKDFQRPWFGKSSGSPVELEDMTYKEVLFRLVELMFANGQRWVDQSWKTMVMDFCQRIEARFNNDNRLSSMQSSDKLDQPSLFLDRFVWEYPACSETLMRPQDIQFFLQLCRRRGQKPVPFVPCLDDDFEMWMKKDSLWQSQELESVTDKDVGRVAILQGPVAVRHVKTVNEPIQKILDSINQGWIEKLIKSASDGTKVDVPEVAYLGGERLCGNVDANHLDGINVSKSGYTTTLSLRPGDGEFNPNTWFTLISGKEPSWRKAIFSQPYIMMGRSVQANYLRILFAPRKDMAVKMLQTRSDTSFTLQETSGSKNLTAQLQFSDDEITLEIITLSQSSETSTLHFQYIYKPEFGYLPIREIHLDRNVRIKLFYYKLWFGSDDNPPKSHFGTFKTSPSTITSEAVLQYVQVTNNRNKAYQPRAGHPQSVPLSMAVVLARKSLMQPLFAETLDGDLLKLVHLSVDYTTSPGSRRIEVGDTISSESTVTAVLISDHGKIVEVSAKLFRGNEHVMDVTSQVQFRGTYDDFSGTFQRKIDPTRLLRLETPLDIAVLKSKQWIQFDSDPEDLLGSVLEFHSTTHLSYRDPQKGLWRTMEVSGDVFTSNILKENTRSATIDFVGIQSHGNPVADYLSRRAELKDQLVRLENPILLNTETRPILSPPSNAPYSRASGDTNPIHTSRIFAAIADLPGTITHGMWTCAAVQNVIEVVAAGNEPEKIQAFSCTCTGMVLPNETLIVECEHTAMVRGSKFIEFRALNKATGNEVLRGQAIILQPSTSYVFTGQGSQSVNMGMDLYQSSSAARHIWDQGEEWATSKYGFSILDIIRNNPKVLTIHLRGQRGRAILQNYLSLGSSHSPLPETITKDSQSITFDHPEGLLFSTQFAQPALLLYAVAAKAELSSRGVVLDDGVVFAGHSLGEYAALASMTNMISLERWLSLVFFRGLIIQSIVERDDKGKTAYAMIAINPGKISPELNQEKLERMVAFCSNSAGCLLEIVNYNVENHQYICAGHTRALSKLRDILSSTYTDQGSASISRFILPLERGTTSSHDSKVIQASIGITPLSNIDIPFHSSLLASGVAMYKEHLELTILANEVNPSDLIDRWVPNLVGIPFSLDVDFIGRCNDMIHRLKGM